jgi:hypothetical protein
MYEASIKTKLRFQDINLEFIEIFLFYCQKIEKINNNTIGGHHNFKK